MLITKPTATTCMAMSLEMPNRLQLKGISSSEPPATPEVDMTAMVHAHASVDTPRQQQGKQSGQPQLCLADFIAPRDIEGEAERNTR